MIGRRYLPRGRQSPMTRNRVVAVLKQAGHPMTTLEIAAVMNAKAVYLSSQLSRFADNGFVHRDKRTEEIAGHVTTYCLWSAPHAG